MVNPKDASLDDLTILSHKELLFLYGEVSSGRGWKVPYTVVKAEVERRIKEDYDSRPTTSEITRETLKDQIGDLEAAIHALKECHIGFECICSVCDQAARAIARLRKGE